MAKQFVQVTASFDTLGNITPISIVVDGITYPIDRVREVKQCCSFKVGGIGMRYQVVVGGHTTYIFLEDNRWFVE